MPSAQIITMLTIIMDLPDWDLIKNTVCNITALPTKDYNLWGRYYAGGGLLYPSLSPFVLASKVVSIV